MTIETRSRELVLVQRSTGLDLSLAPLQGLWTEAQYLVLTDGTNQLIEFTDGHIEVLPMPTRNHQIMLLQLYGLLETFLQLPRGIVLVAPLRLQIRPGKYREPDVLLLLDERDERNQNAFWLGADLVVEIVSPDDPERDTVDKVADYAEANIPEYWIVNPLEATITVLMLAGDAYATHGIFQRGQTATSPLLPGLAVDVDAMFADA